MKSKLKPILWVSLLVLLTFALTKYFKKSSEEMFFSTTKYRLRETLLCGVVLQDAFSKRVESRNIPLTQEELQLMCHEAAVLPSGMQEHVSDTELSSAATKLSFTFDGKGGWWFDTNRAQLHLNSDVKFYVVSSKIAWIQLNDIEFEPGVKVPIVGTVDGKTKVSIQAIVDEAETLKKELKKATPG